jgi:hypothetical protein
MNRAFPVLVLAACCAALAGCGDGLFAVLGRVNADPSPTAPCVVSFGTEYSIAVSWPGDNAAEEYILERADDAVNPTWTVAYRGTATSFDDGGRSDQARYLYRLKLARGTKIVGPSASVIGVGSAACRDALESNDLQENATQLDYDRAANLYYYRSYAGDTVEDIDWYSVSIPPRRTANIVVTQQGLGGGAVSTFMFLYVKGNAPVTVINNQAVPIANTSYVTQECLIRISPNPDQFIADPTLAGGSFIDYTVSLVSITGL